MSTAEILEFVTDFADKSHGTQVRKYTGERYIEHPVRVMEMVRKYHPRVEVLAAALLHDVLEDTPVKPPEMEAALLRIMDEGQVQAVMQLVIELTDVYVKKDYPKLNRETRKAKEAVRLSAACPEAQSIKYADLIDNVTDIVRQDKDFANTFVREAKRLLSVMDAGHPALRSRAMTLVEKCIGELPKSPASF